ncbi:hypothetical protein OG455_18585 [Kitasatospora sp. NBC_01287]|uniref:hypothetical protein n=1 Tax=Kitasatospora sp. NBC_01287 TaxID=2903573 RepID=UPI002253BC42|nr:hypothetical protein [Kitasatospora sp. NBC_01287]MCX4747499.1 hypothetical protein [Kitasatospora sp. NBC_01287]
MTAVHTSVLPPYAAHLRVYEPLAAFPEPDRARWQAYAAEHGPDAASADEPVARAALEAQRGALADLLPRPPRARSTGAPPAEGWEWESEHAFVRVADSVTYVCPWATRLRSWQALEELRDSLPVALLDTVLPEAVREQAQAAQATWRSAHPDARPWILTSRWEVPRRWFLPFGDEERHFRPAEPREGERPGRPAALFYLTSMAQARRRVARAYRVLRTGTPAAEGPGRVAGTPLAAGAEEVGRWLEEFHPRSLVELDYGGLVHAIREPQLAADRSAAELAQGLEALRAGDVQGAVRAYEAVTERWRAVLALRQAN